MPKKSAAKKKGRQKRLPGMSDAKLEALHNAALDYADIRDQRQALTTDEVKLKKKLLDLLHKYKKTHYEYQGVTIDLVVEKEKVKVKVVKPDDEPEDVTETAPAQEPDESELEDVGPEEEFDPEEAEEELAEVEG